MTGSLLTAANWPIIGQICTLLGKVMNAIYMMLDNILTTDQGLVGLSIIIYTILVYTCMMPLTIKQQRTSKMTSVMNPEIQAIQKKYRNKRDQASMMKQQEEMQKVYDKYGTSMTSGCLPMLIQLPILFALYRVIYNIPAYVPSVRVYFDNVVTPLMQQPDYASLLSGITNLTSALGGTAIENYDFANANKLVDMLYKFTTAQWGELEALFPSISGVIAENAAVVEQMNSFLGLNMAEAPGWMPSFAWIIPILSALTQWLSAKLMSGRQAQSASDSDNPMAQSMKTMNVTMPIFSAFICVTLPCGIGIYWIATSVVTILQQLAINSYMDKVDIDEMVKKNLEKANKKRAKKGLPPAKITQNATASLKTLKEEEEKEKAAEEAKKERIAKQIEESNKLYNTDAKPGSIAAKAAMVQKYNEAHEKRK